MARNIRKNDIVQIISGDQKGAQGKVLRIDPRRNRVVVEGVNVVFRHVRPSKRNPQGGRVEKEAPIHLSNVLPMDSKTGRGSRVHVAIERDSSGAVVTKKRVATSGTVLGTISGSSQEK